VLESQGYGYEFGEQKRLVVYGEVNYDEGLPIEDMKKCWRGGLEAN